MQKLLQRLVMAAALLWLFPASLHAQWLDFKTPGIPRTPDGKPDLTAPAPRTADGHPDLSGLWDAGGIARLIDLITDIKDAAIFRPAAQAIFLQRASEYDRDAPDTNCLPMGPADVFVQYRIIQTPTIVALLLEDGGYRQVFLDGRELPKDPDPTWRGYSVGHWEGDTLVVETAGFNDRGWLDHVGHPHSEKLRVTERFQRVDFGHMQLQMTFDDPEVMTKPLTVSQPVKYLADTSILEYVCQEGERDRAHITGKLEDKVKLSDETLKKYQGTYGSNTNPVGFFAVTWVNGRLYFGDLPMFPQSETKFDAPIETLEFSLDANGAVTGLTLVTTGLKLPRRP
jgi:hypothetical protein